MKHAKEMSDAKEAQSKLENQLNIAETRLETLEKDLEKSAQTIAVY